MAFLASVFSRTGGQREGNAVFFPCRGDAADLSTRHRKRRLATSQDVKRFGFFTMKSRSDLGRKSRNMFPQLKKAGENKALTLKVGIAVIRQPDALQTLQASSCRVQHGIGVRGYRVLGTEEA